MGGLLVSPCSVLWALGSGAWGQQQRTCPFCLATPIPASPVQLPVIWEASSRALSTHRVHRSRTSASFYFHLRTISCIFTGRFFSATCSSHSGPSHSWTVRVQRSHTRQGANIWCPGLLGLGEGVLFFTENSGSVLIMDKRRQDR